MQGYIGYRDAAEFLGMKEGTLYSWVSKKRIPHHRIGNRCVRFSLAELADWMESKRVASIRHSVPSRVTRAAKYLRVSPLGSVDDIREAFEARVKSTSEVTRAQECRDVLVRFAADRATNNDR